MRVTQQTQAWWGRGPGGGGTAGCWRRRTGQLGGEKPEGDPGCCRLQNSRMTFSRMLPPACHWNTVWLIKVSVALDFHWHSTPRATLGALRQAIHTEGRMGDIRRERERGAVETRGQPLEDSRADPSNNRQRVSSFPQHRGEKLYIRMQIYSHKHAHYQAGILHKLRHGLPFPIVMLKIFKIIWN